MAKDPDADVTPHEEVDEPEVETVEEQPAGETPAEGSPETPAEEESDDSVTVSIGEEEPEQEPPPSKGFIELRSQYRERVKELKDLRAKVARLETPQAAPKDEPEPTLEAADYDEAEFKRRFRDWNQKQLAKDEEARQARDAQAKQQAEWDAKLADYGRERAALKVRDFEEAEEVFTSILSPQQQAAVLEAASTPAAGAQLVYALGKHPAKARELAAIPSLIKLSVAVAELEKHLKVTPRTQVPPPEKVVRSSAPAAGSTGRELDRLRAEAEKTGDYTKVVAYKRQNAQKAAK